MTSKMEAAADAVRSILPSPFRLSDRAQGYGRGIGFRGTGDNARYAVLDDLDRQVCELVISHEAAEDEIVTYDFLYRADLPGNLRDAMADGGVLYVVTSGVEVRDRYA